MTAKQFLAVVFAAIFVVVFVLANWKGNAFLRLGSGTRIVIALGVWAVLATLVIVSHVLQ